MYKAEHILPVLTIKDLINEDGKPTKPLKLARDKTPSISHLRALFCPCVVQKSTSHVRTKALNMRHQSQKGLCGIFVGISQHQKGYLFYVPRKRNIISLYNILFDESFSSSFTYTSQPY